MPTLARPEKKIMFGKILKAASILVLAVAAMGQQASGAPAKLSNEADLAAFAARLKEFSGASRVRWDILARSRADADAIIARVGLLLSPSDRFLLARTSGRSFDEDPDLPHGAGEPVATMAPMVGQTQSGQVCSWQVWVSDPEFPSPGDNAVSVPLAPSDRLPVSSAATFRLVHTGLLQSHLYAFDETRPGAIRDLAIANNVNIPVSAGPDNETILLASSREPAPYFEGIKKSLSTSGGERRDLDKPLVLRDNLLGMGRGIGSNIQPVAPNMVVARNDVSAKTPRNANDPISEAASGALIELCQYTLIPTSSISQ
jgi:hypothetical protein